MEGHKHIYVRIHVHFHSRTHAHIHVQVHVRVRVVLWLWWRRRERREETNRTMSQLIPSAVSLKIAETEQLYQVKANDWRNRERVVLDLFSN